MSDDASSHFDITRAHRHFSADCFNRTWTLMERPDRTAAETEAMLLCAAASLWHWTQRADRTDRNLSIGHWQVSRAFAVAGQGENAMRHAQRSLDLAQGSPAFYAGYAHEAIARAALLLAEGKRFDAHLKEARACAVGVDDAEERQALERDLDQLESRQRH